MSTSMISVQLYITRPPVYLFNNTKHVHQHDICSAICITSISISVQQYITCPPAWYLFSSMLSVQLDPTHLNFLFNVYACERLLSWFIIRWLTPASVWQFFFHSYQSSLIAAYLYIIAWTYIHTHVFLNTHKTILAMSSPFHHTIQTQPNSNSNFNLFHPFDNNVYRIHPSFLILSFYNSIWLMQFIYNIKICITIMIHIQHKSIQLLSANTDKHSYDSSYSFQLVCVCFDLEQVTISLNI